jgi:hypothetical protein
MDVHKDNGRLQAQAGDLGGCGKKRVLKGCFHEGPALQIHDADRSVCGIENDTSSTRSTRGVIQGAQEPWFRGEEWDDFLLIPDMIPRRNDGDPTTHQGDGKFRSNAPAGRGVFAVSHHKVGITAFQIEFCRAARGNASRFTNHIA